ncbi:MAG TPA: ABC-F family ATP-binding cassette domain-containing protein [Anaerolineae bacterium]|nr:ABC-F family ATP-binding cassette domain-containing protein [Anaerolineae bacterium]HMR64426.1 ABC-F family ATP-binding cassette domain-containing protein [Anaerolineae bacterium]
MTILSVQNLGKYYGGQDVFTDLNFSVNRGDRVALVGPNGEGKTTLLRLIAGVETPSVGQVQTAKNLKIGYLAQHASLASTRGTLWQLALSAFEELRQQETALQEMETALSETTDPVRHDELLRTYGEAQSRFELAGGYGYEQTLQRVLTGLGFVVEDYDKPLSDFSGGEQSRAHLARLLLEQSDLLLLDEPTNHLDLESVEWLENYLQSWPGSIIVVAHDRYFLDKVATGVLELSFGTIESYRGNFSHYVSQRSERFERLKREYETQQEFITKEEEFIRRNIAGQRTKEAQGRRKRLERMERSARPIEHKSLNLALQTTLRSGDLVMATHDLVVGYPEEQPLFAMSDVEIRRGQRVALLGPNGAGKTTFIKTILNQIEPRSGTIRFGAGVKVGYFAQTHSTLNLEASILDEILSVKNLPIGEARNLLGAFLFSGDDVFKAVGTLSGGERSRVALAKLTLTGANFLILDEPTNHLDIASQENLETVLREFTGTILMVSHDRYFVDALATHSWALDPKTKSVVFLEGGYSSYLAYRSSQNGQSQPLETDEKPESQRQRELSKAEKRATERRARQIAEIESTIEATEEKLANLTEALEAASLAQDLARLQQLSQDYQNTEIELEQLLTQWTELESQA